MTYKTGQRFKAKIQGVPVEGRIYVDGEDAWLCQDHSTNEVCEGYLKCSDNLGYKYAWKFRNCEWTNNLKIWGVTDLELLPDADEVSDEIKVSAIGKSSDIQKAVSLIIALMRDVEKAKTYVRYIFSNENEIYELTMLKIQNESKFTSTPLPDPEKLKREEAKQKAEKFMREHMPEMEGQSYGDHSKIMSAIALYILKEKM